MFDPQVLAKSLLHNKSIGFSPNKPITFKSGLVSPVYVDNRTLPFFPEVWRRVLDGFQELVRRENISFDVVAGVESAGIPHSAAFGFFTQTPSVFVRKAAKDHGTKKMIEGGSVDGKSVLLIEDHVTTGGSSLAAVSALRAAGAQVSSCLCITSYNFADEAQSFSAAQVKLHTLLPFSTILETAQSLRYITPQEHALVQRWLEDSSFRKGNWQAALEKGGEYV